MSCFESSTFLKNPLVMNQELLKKACKKLNWKFEVKTELNQEVLYVYTTNSAANLHGEFALKVVGNVVQYNTFYIKNGLQLSQQLESQFYELNVEYAKETVLREFGKVGFKYLPDNKFTPTQIQKERFKMVGHSKMAGETEKRTEIEFTINFDGSIVSDSNYIPEDIHTLADKAMESIDTVFGTTRKEGEQIKRKTIPLKYKNKAYCKAEGKIIAKY